MNLVPIFVDEENSLEGLFAVRYEIGTPDEFERLFEKWTDSNGVFSYLLFYEEKFLSDPYFDNYPSFDLAEKIEEEAIGIYEIFKKYKDDGYKTNKGLLQELFHPLEIGKNHFTDDVLQKSKLKLLDFFQPILRLYGIRIGENTFIITGGAIKLAHFMKDHPDTLEELNKLEIVRKWLIDNEITSHDDIKYSYYEQ